MNVLTEYCRKNERPFKYLADKAGIEYHSLNYYKGMTNSEIVNSMPIEKLIKLQSIIPDIYQQLTEKTKCIK